MLHHQKYLEFALKVTRKEAKSFNRLVSGHLMASVMYCGKTVKRKANSNRKRRESSVSRSTIGHRAKDIK